MFRLSKPSISSQEIQAVTKVLKSGFLVQGSHVAQFEQAICRYLDVDYAVAVNSGTSALHLALLVLEIGPGDEVIIPDYTFPATANVIALTGARPVVVDIEPKTLNIDPAQIESRITKKTKAIMPVHIFGQSAEMDPILAMARKYKLKVIEDAACALGAIYKKRLCGTMGDVGCFSFHPRKVITTGEGGIIVTRHKKLADQLKILRNHGMIYQDNKVDFACPGFNYRMTEIGGAIGLVQMKKLNRVILNHQKIAKLYIKNLSDCPEVTLPHVESFNNHVFQSFAILLKDARRRDQLIAFLKQRNIESNFGTYALHQLRFYKEQYRLNKASFPVAEDISKRAVALPLFEGLAEPQIRFITNQIKRFYE
jgi:perosamine synthetase